MLNSEYFILEKSKIFFQIHIYIFITKWLEAKFETLPYWPFYGLSEKGTYIFISDNILVGKSVKTDSTEYLL